MADVPEFTKSIQETIVSLNELGAKAYLIRSGIPFETHYTCKVEEISINDKKITVICGGKRIHKPAEFAKYIMSWINK